jgi:endonuclease YncB( thermonuclease family)
MPSGRVIHNGPPAWLKKENKMQKPLEGFTTKAEVVRVIDGDTVDLSITRYLRVRLQDCWAPETRTRDIVEKQKGIAARSFLMTRLDGKEVTLFIPADNEGELKDIFTFGRVIGRIFLEDQDISSLMIEAGHASKNKEK